MPPPRFITCQLCGRGFGSASINIHIPQCYDKAIKRWTANPTGPRPVMPGLIGEEPSSGRRSVGGRGASNRQVSIGGLDDQPAGAGASAARSIKRSPASYEMDAAPPVNMNLHPCSKCGRKFNYDRISYHESVCKGDVKRTAFDSSRQRAVGTEEGYGFGGGSYSSKMRGGGAKKRKGGAMGGYSTESNPARVPRTSWRDQHEEFISAIRSARQSDSAAKAMWGAPAAAPRGNPRGSMGGAGGGGMGRPGPPPKARANVPPSMARQSQMHKANIASGGRAARAPPSSMETPGTRRTMDRPRGGDRFSGYGAGGAGGGGGGGGRILNDNTTSLGMMQAFGRA